SKDKEVNQAARDSDDALVCCVENTVEDHIMDFGASFHATYCKEELERFKLRSGKVRLADDKTLDIAGVGDVVLKTSFGTSWTLKDVRYIPGLKRRLISVGQLDEEGYHVGFGDQQWKVTKGSLVVAHGNKRGSLYMVEDWWFGEVEEAFLHDVKEDKKIAETAAGVVGSQRCFWEDSVTMAPYLINRGPSVPLGFRIPEDEWQGKEVSLTHLRVFGCDSYVKMKDVARDKLDAKSYSGSFEDSGRSDEEDSEDRASSEEGGSETLQLRRSTRESRALVRYSPSANYLLLTENGKPESYSEALSSKEFVQWKKAINEEMVSLEKNQTWSLVRLPAGKKALQSKWVFRVKEEQDGKKRYKARLVVKSFQQKQGFMHKAMYKRCAMDHCCYLKKVGSSSIILLLYVDDMLVAGSDMAEIKKIKRHLSQEFEMKDLGPAKQILGMSIIRDKTKGTLRLSQEKYIGKVLEKFNIKDAKARCQPLGDHFKLSKKQAPKTEASRRRMDKVPYASAVGSGMYAMVLRRLLYFSRKEVVLEGFSDSDYGGCLDSGKKARVYRLCRGMAEEWTLSLKKILGAKNPAYMLTKVVTTEKLKLCAASTGLRDN
ncbi:retrovirus-related pol polyprotein from transposon TNT 1-94, partial [Tanacetum coccineum]